MPSAKFTEKKAFGVYVHIPFCKRKCDYCAFVSTPDLSLCKSYTDRLVEEIKNSEYRGECVDTVYIGGGTPSCLPTGELTRIFDALYSAFDVKSRETTVEANPESCDWNFVSECLDNGVNRVSVGLQSCGDNVLRAVGRLHTADGYRRAIERLAHSGIKKLSSDIILGLPEQTDKDVSDAIDLIAVNCNHASVYALTVEEGTPLFRRGYSIDDDRCADLYDLACSSLYARGFKRYEVGNFARNGEMSEHNMKYWECEPYLGFGAAAHGYDGEYIRYAHSESISEYISSACVTKTILTEKDRYNEYIMLRLRTERGIDLNGFYDRFGYSFSERNETELKTSIDDGTVIVKDGCVRIAPERMFVMNGIIERFMLD